MSSNTKADSKASSKKTGLSVLGFVVALGGGFAVGQWFQREDPPPVVLEEGPRYRVQLSGNEPQLGPDDALVTIVEFADYQCPYCARANDPIKAAVEAFEGDVRLLFKHYPLANHARAMPAARAAWAAHEQGRFWEAHDWLFENGADVEALSDHADALGLDMTQLMADMSSKESEDAVDADFFAGGKIGVVGTPVFFVNGHRYVGFRTEDQWEQILEFELAEAKRVLAEGTPRAEVYETLLEGAIEQVAPRSAAPAAGELRKVPVDERPALGPDDALVTWIVFSDFQCPFCEKLTPTMHELVKANDDLRVVFRQLPLPMHARARDAAKASLAAHRQDRFWAMHDALFEHRDELNDLDLSELAGELGLDVERFEADMADPQVETRVREDVELAESLGVQATPSSFVNGRFVSGAQPRERFEALVEEARNEAQALVDAGTPRAEVYAKLMEAIESPEAAQADGDEAEPGSP